MRIRASSTGLCLLAAVAAVGCGSTATSRAGNSPSVVAAFYPLQFVVQQVGGETVKVENLTPAGTEPHDLELTPSQIAGLGKADLIVYLGGFSPAVDDAAKGQSAKAMNVADSAKLTRTGDEGADPHFWLDPTRVADVADLVAAKLGQVDANNAETYLANAKKLRSSLDALDGEFKTALASCPRKALVTSHEAFGYLADRYGFTQVGVVGVSPEQEPTSADLAKVASFVKENGVTTIYSESLVDPATAKTIAAETGASMATLDPLEGLATIDKSSDYFSVMRQNLVALRAGQGC
jgi:zinc transport system substrate-binding protein